MLHKNVGIGDNHPTHNWEYANATARTGATGFVAGDVHKLALQLDDLSLWILVDTTPTWQQFGVGVSTFTALTDTPSSYTGQTGKVVAVNAAENGLEFITGGGGTTSPLTTKGDLYTYSTVNARLPVGTNNQVLTADSTEATGLKWASVSSGSGREVLTANRTYYVRTDGSDSNNGLTDSSGGAFLTIQKAVDIVCSLDVSIYQVTIQVRDGTYAEHVTLKNWVGSVIPILQGNTTTPANCNIQPATTGDVVTLNGLTSWIIQGFKLTSPDTSSNGIFCGYGVLTFGLLVFAGSCGLQLLVTNGGILNCSANYTISSGANIHWCCVEGGRLVGIPGKTITITGTPNFTGAFLYARTSGSATISNTATFSGTATGVRYNISLNSVCFVNGAGTSYLPGNSAGSTSTGGQYA